MSPQGFGFGPTKVELLEAQVAELRAGRCTVCKVSRCGKSVLGGSQSGKMLCSAHKCAYSVSGEYVRGRLDSRQTYRAFMDWLNRVEKEEENHRSAEHASQTPKGT